MMEYKFILVATGIGFLLGYIYANFELDNDFVSIFEINSGRVWKREGKFWKIIK